MIDIEKIQQEIVECLKPLKPDKVILFGSYAHGTAGEDSDIDLFLVKDNENDTAQYQVEAMLRLRDLIRRYHVGFDVLSASRAFLESREDYFYKVDILKNGKVIYAQ
jgi:predicted nucleotidyltransferase